MMHKSDPISPQDIERLSAYLDGDLSPKEAERLEARLRQEVELRRRLDELDHTVAQLRGLPPVRAPRNFTLTPEMAGIKPRRQPVFGFFRFASAVAAVALAVVVSLDVLASSGYMPALNRAAENLAQESGLVGDEGLPAMAAEEPEAELAAPLAMQATEEQEEQLFGEADAVEEAPLEAEGAAEAGGADRVTPTGLFRQGLSAEATATAKMEEFGTQEAPTSQVAPPESFWEAPVEPFWTPFRWVEAGLGTLLVILLLVSFISRRRSL